MSLAATGRMNRPLPLLLALGLSLSPLSAGASELSLDVHQFRFVARESGPRNYYTVVNDPTRPFLHGDYMPGWETSVMGVELPDAVKHASHLRWRWRATVLPQPSGPCSGDKGVADEAALVYLVWKRGLKWYTLRYIWGAGVTKGGVCNAKRGMFRAEDTVALENGPATTEWVSEDLDLPGEFRRHFSGGDAAADVPDLVGLALMTDGDQSRSESAADYADFVFRE